MPRHAKPRKRVNREPVVVAALVPVVVMFATLFGFDLDRDMAAALITAALALATWYARSKVTPVADPMLPPAHH